MKLRFYPYTLELKHKFSISHNSRTTTPIVLTEIKYEGLTGYGEASLPPYLGEDQKSVINFLSKVKLENYSNPLDVQDILNYTDNIEKGNNAAKASVDIALHDLVGKILNIPLHKYFGINFSDTPYSSITIGMDSGENIIQKINEAAQFKILKVKIGSDDDKTIIENIRKVTDKPIIVDVNQGWNNEHKALEMIKWLEGKNVKLIEQPFHKDEIKKTAWLSERSPLPVFADESVWRFSDLEKVYGVFHGINIKLMKSTGLAEAFRMINKAKQFGMQVMLGCMTETSCAISAAAQLSPLAEWADLDGAELIKNDLFSGMKIKDGKITLPNLPGTGAVKKS